MAKKFIYFIMLASILVSCEKNNFTAECSFFVNGEKITNNGGGVSCNLNYFANDNTVSVNYHRISGAVYNNEIFSESDTVNSVNFDFIDNDGGNKSHFERKYEIDVAEINQFYIKYKEKTYKAVSATIDIETGNFIDSTDPFEGKYHIKGTFSAVMVLMENHLDTIYVENGLFNFSEMNFLIAHHP
ncbi:MAG: hypothetical protein LBN95_04015 [Prevotellaceae bacterium]|jgi:hypothetical protein|nr:hypothetical protein [Prevotellaceae bacterium]